MSTARLDLRHVTVSNSVDPSQFDGGPVFVASDDPPPVRTILALVEDGAEPRALEVTKVVEVPEADGSRGFFAKPVDAEKLALNAKVGTEHLDAGEAPPVQEMTESNQLGAPAPVMDPDDSIKIDHSERERLEAEPEAQDEDESESESESESEPESEPEPDPEPAAEEGQSVTSEESGGETSGEIGGGSPEPTSKRRRRGRKRR